MRSLSNDIGLRAAHTAFIVAALAAGYDKTTDPQRPLILWLLPCHTRDCISVYTATCCTSTLQLLSILTGLLCLYILFAQSPQLARVGRYPRYSPDGRNSHS